MSDDSTSTTDVKTDAAVHAQFDAKLEKAMLEAQIFRNERDEALRRLGLSEAASVTLAARLEDAQWNQRAFETRADRCKKERDEEIQADNSCGCPNAAEELGCGGPREACGRPGCDECGTTAPTLEQRLFAARRASGLPLMKFIAIAEEYARGAPTIDLGGLSDARVVEAVEHWVREHPRGEGR
jgi:hypothetical protein